MAKVEFHFDFGSPNAYLAHIVIPEVEQRTGASSNTYRSCSAACSSSPTIARRRKKWRASRTGSNTSSWKCGASSAATASRNSPGIRSFRSTRS